MRPCLIVLNPRRIPEAIESLEALEIPKVWLTGYTEHQLAQGAFNAAIQATEYTHYSVISDDTIVTQTALDAVLALAPQHPVVTGYCNLDSTEDRINLGALVGNTPIKTSYSFITPAQLAALPDPAPTEFAGMCLTTMSRETWAQYPFGCYGRHTLTGYASDFHLCLRLKNAGVPIVAPHAARVQHLKAQWSEVDTTPGRELYLGLERTTHGPSPT